MYLLQILLPLRDNDGRAFPRSTFDAVREELVERFGGVTAFLNSPAEGAWLEEGSGEVDRDRVVTFEVMADALDRAWWSGYRAALERRFRQDEVVVRALAMEKL